MRTSGARANDSCMWLPSPPLTNDILSFQDRTKYQVSHYAVDDRLGKLMERKGGSLRRRDVMTGWTTKGSLCKRYDLIVRLEPRPFTSHLPGVLH